MKRKMTIVDGGPVGSWWCVVVVWFSDASDYTGGNSNILTTMAHAHIDWLFVVPQAFCFLSV